jgi:hypothetical protein
MNVPKSLVVPAMVIGVAGGSYGIASAATGTTPTTATSTVAATTPAAAPTAQQPFGGQRSDETLLTGDTLAKVTAAAEAKVPGGTIIRVETDADGHATYEAHMTDASGNPITVYVDDSFAAVSTETMPRRLSRR